MAKFSSGKRAYLIDDRTGRKIRYRDARTEWTGLRVHKNEWEEKHPQITPPRVRDSSQGLHHPRSDTREDVLKQYTWDDLHVFTDFAVFLDD